MHREEDAEAGWNVAVAFKRLGPSDAASCMGVPHAVFHAMAPRLYSHFGHCEIVLRAAPRPVGDRVPALPGAVHQGQLVSTVYTIDRTSPVRTCYTPRPYFQADSIGYSQWHVQVFRATPRELARLQEFLDAQLGKKFHRAGTAWAGIWLAPFYTPLDTLTNQHLTAKRLCHCTSTPPELRDLPPKKAWFCSELVSAALLYSRILRDPRLEPSSCTPDHLWRHMEEHLHRPRLALT